MMYHSINICVFSKMILELSCNVWVLKGNKLMLALCKIQHKQQMFYVTTHSAHFIYGVGHMVNNHSDSERGNLLLLLHGLLFLISPI